MGNKAIEILMTEHQLILQGMDVADAMANRFAKNGEINRDDLAKVVLFITEYADAFHHKKEEDVLFVWMGERGFPVDSGPIAVMFMEHDMGREFVKVMKDVLANTTTDKSVAVSKSVASLRGFAEHLRQHISKEDNILYPMAMRLAGPENGADILRRYREKVSDADSAAMNQKHEELLKDLRTTYAE